MDSSYNTKLVDIFRYYASIGHSSTISHGKNRLSGYQFLQFCRECPGVLEASTDGATYGDTISYSEVDIIFCRSKSKGSHVLLYDQFLDSLVWLALEKYGKIHDPAKAYSEFLAHNLPNIATSEVKVGSSGTEVIKSSEESNLESNLERDLEKRIDAMNNSIYSDYSFGVDMEEEKKTISPIKGFLEDSPQKEEEVTWMESQKQTTLFTETSIKSRSAKSKLQSQQFYSSGIPTDTTPSEELLKYMHNVLRQLQGFTLGSMTRYEVEEKATTIVKCTDLLMQRFSGISGEVFSLQSDISRLKESVVQVNGEKREEKLIATLTTKRCNTAVKKTRLLAMFLHWHTVAVHSRLFWTKISLLTRKIRVTLLKNNLTRWKEVHKFTVMEKEELKLRNYKKVMLQKFQYQMQNERVSSLRGKLFLRWKMECNFQKNEKTKLVIAQLFAQKKIIRRGFRTWKERYYTYKHRYRVILSILVKKSIREVSRSFRTWRLLQTKDDYTEKIQQNREKFIEQRIQKKKSRMLRLVFRELSLRRKQSIMRRQRVARLMLKRQYQTVAVSFLDWKFWYRQRKAIARYHMKRDTRIYRKVFSTWQHFHKELLHEAKKTRELALVVKRTGAAILREIIQRHNLKIMGKRYRRWSSIVLHEHLGIVHGELLNHTRIYAIKRQREMRVLKRAYQKWHNLFLVRMKRRQCLSRLIQKKRRATQLIVFNEWRSTHQYLTALAQKSSLLQKRVRIMREKTIIKQWLSCSQRQRNNKKMISIANKWFAKASKGTIFKRWHKNATRRLVMKKLVLKKIHKVHLKKMNAVFRKLLLCAHAKEFQEKQISRTTQTLMVCDKKRQLKICLKFFRTWSRHCGQKSLEFRRKIFMKRVVRNHMNWHFHAWKQYIIRRQAIYTEVEERFRKKRKEDVSRVFRVFVLNGKRAFEKRKALSRACTLIDKVMMRHSYQILVRVPYKKVVLRQGAQYMAKVLEEFGKRKERNAYLKWSNFVRKSAQDEVKVENCRKRRVRRMFVKIFKLWLSQMYSEKLRERKVQQFQEKVKRKAMAKQIQDWNREVKRQIRVQMILSKSLRRLSRKRLSASFRLWCLWKRNQVQIRRLLKTSLQKYFTSLRRWGWKRVMQSTKEEADRDLSVMEENLNESRKKMIFSMKEIADLKEKLHQLKAEHNQLKVEHGKGSDIATTKKSRRIELLTRRAQRRIMCTHYQNWKENIFYKKSCELRVGRMRCKLQYRLKKRVFNEWFITSIQQKKEIIQQTKISQSVEQEKMSTKIAKAESLRSNHLQERKFKFHSHIMFLKWRDIARFAVVRKKYLSKTLKAFKTRVYRIPFDHWCMLVLRSIRGEAKDAIVVAKNAIQMERKREGQLVHTFRDKTASRILRHAWILWLQSYKQLKARKQGLSKIFSLKLRILLRSSYHQWQRSCAKIKIVYKEKQIQKTMTQGNEIKVKHEETPPPNIENSLVSNQSLLWKDRLVCVFSKRLVQKHLKHHFNTWSGYARGRKTHRTALRNVFRLKLRCACRNAFTVWERLIWQNSEKNGKSTLDSNGLRINETITKTSVEEETTNNVSPIPTTSTGVQTNIEETRSLSTITTQTEFEKPELSNKQIKRIQVAYELICTQKNNDFIMKKYFDDWKLVTITEAQNRIFADYMKSKGEEEKEEEHVPLQRAVRTVDTEKEKVTEKRTQIPMSSKAVQSDIIAAQPSVDSSKLVVNKTNSYLIICASLDELYDARDDILRQLRGLGETLRSLGEDADALQTAYQQSETIELKDMYYETKTYPSQLYRNICARIRKSLKTTNGSGSSSFTVEDRLLHAFLLHGRESKDLNPTLQVDSISEQSIESLGNEKKCTTSTLTVGPQELQLVLYELGYCISMRYIHLICKDIITLTQGSVLTRNNDNMVIHFLDFYRWWFNDPEINKKVLSDFNSWVHSSFILRVACAIRSNCALVGYLWNRTEPFWRRKIEKEPFHHPVSKQRHSHQHNNSHNNDNKPIYDVNGRRLLKESKAEWSLRIGDLQSTSLQGAMEDHSIISLRTSPIASLAQRYNLYLAGFELYDPDYDDEKLSMTYSDVEAALAKEPEVHFFAIDFTLNELANDDIRDEALNAVRNAFTKYAGAHLKKLPLYKSFKVELINEQRKFCVSANEEYDPFDQEDGNSSSSSSSSPGQTRGKGRSKRNVKETFWLIRLIIHFEGSFSDYFNFPSNLPSFMKWFPAVLVETSMSPKLSATISPECKRLGETLKLRLRLNVVYSVLYTTLCTNFLYDKVLSSENQKDPFRSPTSWKEDIFFEILNCFRSQIQGLETTSLTFESATLSTFFRNLLDLCPKTQMPRTNAWLKSILEKELWNHDQYFHEFQREFWRFFFEEEWGEAVTTTRLLRSCVLAQDANEEERAKVKSFDTFSEILTGIGQINIQLGKFYCQIDMSGVNPFLMTPYADEGSQPRI
eukprot:g1937.t1